MTSEQQLSNADRIWAGSEMSDQDTLAEWCLSLCTQGQDVLVDLVQTHLEIDLPTRAMRAEDPHWIGRLRKVLHHVRAITSCEISADVEHVMATELRAAYRQMESIWQALPNQDDIYEWHRDYWRAEANELGRYDHPTGYNLYYTLGGILGDDRTQTLGHLALWIHRLGLGYAVALDYLSQTLNKENYDIVSARIEEILQKYPMEPPEALRTSH